MSESFLVANGPVGDFRPTQQQRALEVTQRLFTSAKYGLDSLTISIAGTAFIAAQHAERDGNLQETVDQLRIAIGLLAIHIQRASMVKEKHSS